MVINFIKYPLDINNFCLNIKKALDKFKVHKKMVILYLPERFEQFSSWHPQLQTASE